MKVLQVISSISAARGGPSTALRNLLQALHRQGIETDVATTDDDGANKQQAVARNVFLPLHGGRVIYFAKQTGFYAASLPMLRWLMAHACDYDLVHVHGLFNFAASAGALTARLSAKPYLITPHGTLNSWGRQYRRPQLKHLSMRLLESRIIAGARLLHFTSDVEQHEATELGLRTRGTVVPLGLDIETLMTNTGGDDFDALNSQQAMQHSILFLSRIDRIKNLDVLLHAMQRIVRQCPATLLLIAGDGDPALVSELQSLGRTLKLENNLRWLGFVSGAQKQWLLRNCKVLAMPSQSENFGLSAVEAMANAMPVVVTPGVGLAPMVERYAAGSVCNVDPDALAATLTELLMDEQRRTTAGLAAQRLVSSELSIEIFGQRLLQMYEQALSETTTSVDIYSCNTSSTSS